jgi:sulfatase modifying factor 1
MIIPSSVCNAIKRISILGVLCCWAISNEAATSGQGFFRIQGATNTAITGFTSSGLLTWTNAAVSNDCTVEWLGSLGVSNVWQPFVNYPVISPVCQVQVFVPTWPAPTGMSFLVTTRFQMGNCMDTNEGYADELPLRNVYVTPFFMDQVEVCKALWDNVYGWATNHGYGFDNVGFGKGPDYPVGSVNWYDTVKWCNARSEKESLMPAYNTYEYVLDEFGDPIGTNIVVYREGSLDITAAQVNWVADGYRLPTEAEWELAARGGTAGNRFPWPETDTITQTNANYYSSWDGGAPYYPYDVNEVEGSPFGLVFGVDHFTSPVGVFLPNAYGLSDMAGNVSEWCWDWYGFAYYATGDATDPKGPDADSGSGRVVRGGSGESGAFEARCSARSANGAGGSLSGVGFRCVRSR